MLAKVARRSIVCMVRRPYGYEDEGSKKGSNFWQYSRFTNVGGLTPEEQGFQMSGQFKARQNELNKQYRSVNNFGSEITGTEGHRLMDYELNDHPLGEIHDKQLETIPANEVKTRMIHVLRHFEKVDLRKLDWDASLETDMGLDSLDRIALITSVEHDFRTVFEDVYFDNIQCLNDMVNYISQETYAY